MQSSVALLTVLVFVTIHTTQAIQPIEGSKVKGPLKSFDVILPPQGPLKNQVNIVNGVDMNLFPRPPVHVRPSPVDISLKKFSKDQVKGPIQSPGLVGKVDKKMKMNPNKPIPKIRSKVKKPILEKRAAEPYGYDEPIFNERAPGSISNRYPYWPHPRPIPASKGRPPLCRYENGRKKCLL